jgi:hypothetical protein
VVKSHQKGAVVRRESGLFRGEDPDRRNSEMTLEEQISEVKREVEEATQMSEATSDVTNDRENLSLKDKIKVCEISWLGCMCEQLLCVRVKRLFEPFDGGSC